MPSVSLEAITKRFNGITAINNLDLQVDNEDYVCIVGPTGSGKSTLLRLVAGLLLPDEGKILFDGVDITEMQAEDRGAVYVPQQYALFPHLTILQNVAFGPLARGASEKRALRIAQEMLQLMRLAQRSDSFPEELSGGMQQRVALARGLATEARLLLLDEPLGALDARLRVELRQALRELAKHERTTTVHVTHDQEEAMAVGDKIAVLRQGRVEQYATPFHTYSRPQTLFAAHFVGGANFLPCIVANRTVKESTVELHKGLEVHVADATYAPGEEAVLAIREEMIRLTANTNKNIDMDVFNIIDGEIRASRFLGSFVGYEVQLSNGDIVNSKCPISTFTEPLLQGQKVRIYFAPGETMVYSFPSLGLSRELAVY
ncbi:MAG: ABC transporter ATP-binding protein [archaeon]